LTNQAYSYTLEPLNKGETVRGADDKKNHVLKLVFRHTVMKAPPYPPLPTTGISISIDIHVIIHNSCNIDNNPIVKTLIYQGGGDVVI
jgi:hypothetical protein